MENLAESPTKYDLTQDEAIKKSITAAENLRKELAPKISILEDFKAAAGTKVSALEANAPVIATKSFNQSHVPGGSQWVRAFVATGSSDGRILATVAGINTSGALPICVACEATTYGNQEGIRVTVFFNLPPTNIVTLNITFYQIGAKYYNDPVVHQ